MTWFNCDADAIYDEHQSVVAHQARREQPYLALVAHQTLCGRVDGVENHQLGDTSGTYSY
jgi:hypothetical protein